MADEEDRSFEPGTVSSNRAQMQGLGVGQQEINRQRPPNRDTYATEPDRTEPFDEGLDRTTNSDRPSQADFSGQEPGDVRGEERRFDQGEDPGPDGDGLSAQVGDLGVGTPANVDIHNLGQNDNPEQEWGEPAGEGATFSSNNTRKGIRTEAERSQGAKTRRLNKDIISRRT